MSRDIFAQDLPPAIRSVAEIPDDFKPGQIASRSQVLAAIAGVAPKADFSDPSWVIIDHPPDYHIEVNLGNDEYLKGFAFHMRGGVKGELVISRILNALQLRALDPASDSGLFEGYGSGAP